MIVRSFPSAQAHPHLSRHLPRHRPMTVSLSTMRFLIITVDGWPHAPQTRPSRSLKSKAKPINLLKHCEGKVFHSIPTVCVIMKLTLAATPFKDTKAQSGASHGSASSCCLSTPPSSPCPPKFPNHFSPNPGSPKVRQHPRVLQLRW